MTSGPHPPLRMLPGSFQSMHQHPSLVLDRMLNSSKDERGDPVVFSKHRMEHMLNAHQKRHTKRYPYDRLHSTSISQGPAKPVTTKIPHVSVSGDLPSLPTADPSLLRPAVRVTVPAQSAPAVRLSRDQLRGKTMDINVSNGFIQNNRALTVPLPEDLIIPDGCLVEVVEVKTVNGTRELKLRFVSQHENQSVIKEARTTVPQNTSLGKPSLSTSHNPNTAKSMSLGMKNLQSHVSRDRSGLKRTSQEIIDVECHSPNKLPKCSVGPVREANGSTVPQRDPLIYSAASPTLTSPRRPNRSPSTLHPENMEACVSQRAVDERNNVIPDHSKRAGDIKPRVKLEPRVHLNNNNNNTNTPSIIKKEAVGLNKQHLKSASPPFVAAAKVRPPAVLVCEDNVANSSFLVPRTLTGSSSVKMPVLCSYGTNSKYSAWTQEVRSSEGEPTEPEGFPVISSVFSLSEQHEEVQASIQPLVLALRGIVMDKSNSSDSKTGDNIKIIDSSDLVKHAPAVGYSSQTSAKDESSPGNLLLTGQTIESVKVETHHKGIQHPPTLSHNHVKEEKESTTTPTDNNKCSHTPASKSSTHEESVSEIATHVDKSVSTQPLQQTVKREQDISSKFLTVSLKRVQVGVWKKSKKGLKLRISKCKTLAPTGRLSDCTVVHLLPLRVDQHVKWPGPDQPVVVLNHPKPRASAQATRADTSAHTAAPQAIPKCQILKMRLHKVTGHKYKVMDCTVGVFP